jgi:aryl-alcohol dehydrogenase-like predicted oxidoreductase
MEYTSLGETGMRVSRICLGCMSFGSSRYEWGLDAERSHAIIDRAIDLGINFFDTANIYNYGESERILGEALSGYDRSWPVVATKVYMEMDEANPNSGGLSRKAIEHELAASKERLGLETIDLYQIHRWDYETAIEETLEALDDAIHRGDVHAIGASSMWAHQLAEALHTSDRRDLARFATMQNHHSLAYREEEREMLPLCAREGLGVIPWSPLAKGFLARPHDERESTRRGRSDTILHRRPYDAGGGIEINERVQELATEYGVSMAQIALAWQLQDDHVDAPIVGVTQVEHVEQAAAAVDLSLSRGDVEYLEAPYQPLPVKGHE